MTDAELHVEPASAVLFRLARRADLTPLDRLALRSVGRLMRQHEAERGEAAQRPDPRPSRPPDYYTVEPAWEWREGDPPRPPTLVNAAVLTCMATDRVLAGNGGGRDALHPDVVELFRRGARLQLPAEAGADRGDGHDRG